MASGTADLQRDLGGAIMQSIFGALLDGRLRRGDGRRGRGAAERGQTVTDSVAEPAHRSRSPARRASRSSTRKYASQITAAAKTSFLAGDQWAYLAGIVAILLGAALVFFVFPGKQQEESLLETYHTEDAAAPAE